MSSSGGVGPKLQVPFKRQVGSHIRKTLIAGLLALIPLVATILVVRIVFTFLDDQVQPLVEEIFGREITGLGAAFTLVAVYLTGLLVANFLGRALVRQFEFLILRVPLVRWVYNVAKQTIDALQAAGKAKFRVVLVQWPSKGTYTIGFQTGTIMGADGKTYLNVLIPTTPTPQSGFLAILPEEEVIFTNMTVEEGVKMVVSSGILTPADLAEMFKEHREGQTAPVPSAVDD